MNEIELKNLIVEIGRRIWTRGFVAANDGNITVKISDDEILTTPTGVSKGFMTSDMIIKVDMSGKVLTKSSQYKPSSEVKMHLEVYKERPDVSSVVHAHPPYCTSFAVAGIPLNQCVLPEAIIVVGAVPIAKYGLPSTNEVPDSIRPHIKTSDAILMQNHGALTLGKSLMDAYHKMETLEHTANIIWKAMQLGNMNVLPEHERDRLFELRDKYNLTGRVNLCEASPTQKDSDPEIKSENLSSGFNNSNIDKIASKIVKSLKKEKGSSRTD